MAIASNLSEIIPHFRRQLLFWYDRHARHLPWRETRDPYRIWLSEIMLQQTRVAAVLEHYREFLRRFPTMQKLAAARETSVLGAWSGLGYYRRARMLHAAAKALAKEHGGKFPQTAEVLQSLPGIGRYTAAAIASIAFGEPIAVVDGNVERVLQRVTGRQLPNGELWKTAEHFLDASRPGDFNQALMELGATVCTPRSPTCLMCPVIELCSTRGEMPKARKKEPQKKREVHYSLRCRNAAVWMVQRDKASSLMAGMWELPEISRAPSFCSTPNGNYNDHPDLLFTVRHSITVTDYTVRVWRRERMQKTTGEWIPVERLSRMPLTGLARKILRKAKILRAPTARTFKSSASRVPEAQ